MAARIRRVFCKRLDSDTEAHELRMIKSDRRSYFKAIARSKIPIDSKHLHEEIGKLNGVSFNKIFVEEAVSLLEYENYCQVCDHLHVTP